MQNTIQRARRVAALGTTIFSEINGLARQYQAVNLGQGAPDFDGHPAVIEAAQQALSTGRNQYAPGHGIPEVKLTVADHARRFYGQEVDPTTEVTITSGATEAMFAAILGLADPGDEVIVFQPVYDSYVPNLQWAGVTPRYVNLYPPHWQFDPDQLRAAFNAKTRAIIINTPHNPTGKVFSRAEMTFIAELCQTHNVIAITDEVYEHLIYDDHEHIRMATLPGMADRALTISSLGKTFSLTGWKIGWAIGSPELVAGVNGAHQFITFAVSTPLQAATAVALSLPDSFFTELRTTFQRKRDYLMEALTEAGFKPQRAQGGYFVMADWTGIAPTSVENDADFSRWLIETVGVACIPPSFFYRSEDRGMVRNWARFAICKRDETLSAAVERLKKIAH